MPAEGVRYSISLVAPLKCARISWGPVYSSAVVALATPLVGAAEVVLSAWLGEVDGLVVLLTSDGKAPNHST
jgi:hypothetical protein